MYTGTLALTALSDRTLYNDGDFIFTHSDTVTNGQIWLLSTWNVASATEQLHLKFFTF